MSCKKTCIVLLIGAMLALSCDEPNLAESPHQAEGSHANAYEIHFKTRRFIPEPDVDHSLLQGGGEHVIIQFDDDIDSKTLESTGIVPINFVSPKTMIAAVHAPVDRDQVPGMRWVGKMKPGDKLDIAVINKLEENPSDENIVVLVEAFNDISTEELVSVASRLGAEVVNHPDFPGYIRMVSGTPVIIEQLADADQIAWISVPNARVLAQEPVYFCPGPITPLGPIGNFVADHQGWDGPGLGSASLTYHFVNGTGDIGGSAERDAVRAALAEWSAYAALTFSETTTAGSNASFDISWVTGDHGDGFPFDGPGGVLAHAYYPANPNPEPIAGDLHFDDAETWSMTGNTHMFTVALHELGHSLGLGHSTVSGAVMQAFYGGPVTGLHSDDIAGIRSIYRSADIWQTSYWTTGYSNSSGWAAEPYYWDTIEHPDLNGDGRDDICGRASGGIYCALSNGSAFGSPSYWTSAYSNNSGWAAEPYYWSTIRYPDLNGDGRADVCGRASGGIYCALSNGSAFGSPSYWTSAYSNNGGWAAEPYYWSTIRYPDLNGDGRADVCGRASGGIYCALSNGGAFGNPSYWTSAYSNDGGWAANEYYWGTIDFPDLNNDGRADVCGRASGGIYCALSNGSAFGSPSYWTSAYSNDGGWAANEYYWGTIDFPDLNNDGRADVCGRASGGIYCALSNGSAFGSPSYWTSAYSNDNGWAAEPYYWSTIRFPDLNDDGRADVCGRASGGIYCATSTGGSFNNTGYWTSNYSNNNGWAANEYYWGTIGFPDLNGDGRADVCGRASGGIYCGIE